MMTREEYMTEMNQYPYPSDERSEIHHRYYSQFINDHTFRFVEMVIGLDKIKASTDPHLNDVVPWENGRQTWAWDRTPINTTLAKECGEIASMTTRACVGKAAAKILLNR